MGARLPPAERARRLEIIARFHASGAWTWDQIGTAVGMPARRIARWWQIQVEEAAKPPRVRVYRQKGDVQLKAGETRRLCMTCGEPFASSGSGHRLCNTHRLMSSAPYELDYVTSGRQVGARRS